jgi:DNA mismatch repair protein MutL
MFELLLQRIEREPLESQRLLAPAVLDAGSERIEALESLSDLLKKIGVDAEASGPRSIAVHAFPTFLFDRGVEPQGFLGELLDRAGELTEGDGRETSESALHEVLDMMACKAAVKAGDRMSETELSALVELREGIERSSSCPHGRPTSVRLTIKQLEKLFHRT